MDKIARVRLSRRDLQKLAMALPVPLAALALGGRSAGIALAQSDAATATPPTLAPTPACGDDDEPTPAQTAGPFFTPSSPERASLREPGLAGTPLTLRGFVYTTDCRPVPGALLDFWQADDAGVYDNEGYRLRGNQFADEDGAFILETIVPGLYPGRTRHIHVNAQAPDGPILTTQLYFPDEPANVEDGIFDPDLTVDIEPGDADEEGLAATFTFVLEAD